VPEFPPTPADVCAVMVTYLPDEGFPARLEKVTSQFSQTIVVDNSPSDRAPKELSITTALPRIHVVSNATNIGVAAALNQGIEKASELGFRWVITLDQDTEVEPRMPETLLEEYRLLPAGDALLGANYWDVHKGQMAVPCCCSTRDPKERKTVITSGCLIPISLFRDIGSFREDYFIDSVDHEFCLRARAHGYRVFITCRPLMRQSVGAAHGRVGRICRLLGRRHSAPRKYFMARNSLATVKTYLFREPTWGLCQVARLVAEVAFILSCERERSKQLRAFAVGVLHGVKGRLGPIEETWPSGAS
jgi:rhamnosyltransferase